jgi:5-methylcytosine-specific restriction protein A
LARIEAAIGDKRRPNANKRGYTYAWSQTAKRFLNDHPLCATCLRNAAIEAATVVDHIVPHRGDKHLFWDRANWQPLCETCHNRKTGRGG